MLTKTAEQDDLDVSNARTMQPGFNMPRCHWSLL